MWIYIFFFLNKHLCEIGRLSVEVSEVRCWPLDLLSCQLSEFLFCLPLVCHQEHKHVWSVQFCLHERYNVGRNIMIFLPTVHIEKNAIVVNVFCSRCQFKSVKCIFPYQCSWHNRFYEILSWHLLEQTQTIWANYIPYTCLQKINNVYLKEKTEKIVFHLKIVCTLYIT